MSYSFYDPTVAEVPSPLLSIAVKILQRLAAEIMASFLARCGRAASQLAADARVGGASPFARRFHRSCSTVITAPIAAIPTSSSPPNRVFNEQEVIVDAEVPFFFFFFCYPPPVFVCLNWGRCVLFLFLSFYKGVQIGTSSGKTVDWGRKGRNKM